MRDQEWDASAAELDALDLAELVLGLIRADAVNGEAALGVVDEAEVLARLFDGDDVHEAGRVGHVGADLAVDLDVALHDNGLGLAVVERVLEPVPDKDDERHAFAQLVRAGRRPRRVRAGELVEQPVRRGAEALLVLLPGVGQRRVLRSFCSRVSSNSRSATHVDDELGSEGEKEKKIVDGEVVVGVVEGVEVGGCSLTGS